MFEHRRQTIIANKAEINSSTSPEAPKVVFQAGEYRESRKAMIKIQVSKKHRSLLTSPRPKNKQKNKKRHRHIFSFF